MKTVKIVTSARSRTINEEVYVPCKAHLRENKSQNGQLRRNMSCCCTLAATRSSAPDVGMDLATPFKPPLDEKYGMQFACAAMMATESDGVTKNRSPRIMLRSASPSAAAPKEGTCNGKKHQKTSYANGKTSDQTSYVKATQGFGSANEFFGGVGRRNMVKNEVRLRAPRRRVRPIRVRPITRTCSLPAAASSTPY